MIEGTQVDISCTGTLPVEKILKLNPLLTNQYKKDDARPVRRSTVMFAKDKLANQLQIIKERYKFSHGSHKKKRKK